MWSAAIIIGGKTLLMLCPGTEIKEDFPFEFLRKHEVQPEKVMSYTIDQEAGVLKELRVKYYRDARRLNEIKDKVRWTFRRMYEKTIGT